MYFELFELVDRVAKILNSGFDQETIQFSDCGSNSLSKEGSNNVSDVMCVLKLEDNVALCPIVSFFEKLSKLSVDNTGNGIARHGVPSSFQDTRTSRIRSKYNVREVGLRA